MTGPEDPRTPFKTFAEAQAAADRLHFRVGWEIEAVYGEQPAGPPKKQRCPSDSDRRDSRERRWRNVPTLPPKITAIAPDGRRVSIGSTERLEALLASFRETGNGRKKHLDSN